MQICTKLEEIPTLSAPIGLTIGTFDGMHLGHQALFRRLRSLVTDTGSIAALTFTSHPSHTFNGQAPTPLLCTLDHKIKLLQDFPIDLLILQEFNAEFASQSFDVFLHTLKHSLPFTYLVLGEGASFGKNRQGSEEQVKALSKTLDFSVEYLPKLLHNDTPISSGRIRNALRQGDLATVSSLLGRPYSIFAPIINNQMHVPHLCLPPDGIYPIHAAFHPGTAQVANAEKTIRLAFSESYTPPRDYPVEMIF